MDSSEVGEVIKVKILKIFTKVIYWLAIALLAVIALGTVFSVLEAPGGHRLFVVQSGSMEPAIKAGSVVLVAPQKQYKKDEIITFLHDSDANLKDLSATVTHRIFSVHDDEGRATFTTKGDANEDPDQEKVTERQVLGKALFSLPYAGYVVSFAKTKRGLLLLVIFPVVLIICGELMSIKNEVKKLIKERRK